MRRVPLLRLVRLGLLATTLAGALWLGSVAAQNEAVKGLILQGGYLGVFLFSIINGFNVIVPMVTPSFVPALSASGLNPVILILVMTAGMTIADSAAYVLGRLGRAHIGGAERVARTLAQAEERRHSLPLFILFLWAAVVPFPTEVVAVPIGLLGYRAHLVLPVIAAGTLVFNALVGLGFVNVVSLFA